MLHSVYQKGNFFLGNFEEERLHLTLGKSADDRGLGRGGGDTAERRQAAGGCDGAKEDGRANAEGVIIRGEGLGVSMSWIGTLLP